jgi:hypothetical protein
MKKIILALAVICLMLTSCTPYEDFTKDSEKAVVYFGTQKPLRTIVAYNDMQFKVGVALGGKRSNDQDEFVDFVIDPSLLTTIPGANAYTLLPESYYSISNVSRMIIPKGKFIGDVTITLNRDLFINDPKSLSKTYALPLKITSTSVKSTTSGESDSNSILALKDYTILVVKYISPYSGTFYQKGTQTELDASGVPIDSTEKDPNPKVLNTITHLNSVDLNSLRTTSMGEFSNHNFLVHINEVDNKLTFDTPSPGVTNFLGSGTYNPVSRSFSLEYKYTAGGKNYHVTNELTLVSPPEQLLRFETW